LVRRSFDGGGRRGGGGLADFHRFSEIVEPGRYALSKADAGRAFFWH
jgi:hypothetical protein